MGTKQDLTEIFGEDAQELRAPTQEGLSKVSELAIELRDRAEAVTAAEEALKQAKKQLAQIAEVELPDAMDEVGLAEFTLTDGGKVTVKRGFAPNLTKAKVPAAYKWLRENGHGAIIKTAFDLKFGADEDDAAKAFAEILDDEGYTYGRKESIHASTLKSFVNEQMTKPTDELDEEQGEPFPQDLFGCYPYRIASVK